MMEKGATGTSKRSADGVGVRERELVALLRLLGAGASSAILLALGTEPLRTKALTALVSGYAPRTVYRYVSRLVEIGAIEREEEPGVPTKVVHSLTEPCGSDLHELVQSYAEASALLQRLRDGRIVPQSWSSVTLLADLWESGMFERLNSSPCTATELARADHDLSFHQVSRRINLLAIGGMIREAGDAGRGRRYELTPEARQSTALIAGLGRWRERYAVGPGEVGLTTGEVAELLRAALPLLVLPEHAGSCFKLTVLPLEGGVEEEAVVWGSVRASGRVRCAEGTNPDGWGRGSVPEWISTVLGTRSKVRSGGDAGAAVKACLKGVAKALWQSEPAPQDHLSLTL